MRGSFRGDRRGVSVQVGGVLLAGTLVLALAGYQAAVVPASTASVEATHQTAVRGDLAALDGAITRAGATGTTQPTTVELGTDYPDELLAVTPPPASGSLRVTPVGGGGSSSVAIEGAVALNGETRDVWNGTRRYPTRALTYRPAYNEFDGGETVGVEGSVRYADDGSGPRPLGEQTLVDGRRVTLVTLAGQTNRSGSGTVTVDPRALSPAGTEVRSVAVRNTTGRNVTLRVPTRLSASQWAALLADEPAEAIGVSGGRVTIELDPGTYELRLVRVGVGTNATAPGARYLTTTERGNLARTVPAGTNETLTIEARDRYDNPVSGVDVRATVDGAGSIVGPTGRTTDESGRARFRYRAPAGGPANATVRAAFGPGNESTRVDFRVGVPATGVAGGDRIVWDSRFDWDGGPDSTRESLVYADFGDHESTNVELGEGNESEGLLAYWSLDGAGGNATDETGGGYDLSTAGGTVVFDRGGTFGTSAVTFPGDSQDYLRNDTPRAQGLGDGFSGVTVAAWVRSNVTGVNNGVFSTDGPNDGSDDGIAVRYDASAFFDGQNGGDPATNVIKAAVTVDESGGEVPVQFESESDVQVDDAWQHVAFTWSSGDPIEVYVNGTEVPAAFSGTGDGTPFSGGRDPPEGTTVPSETGDPGLYVGAGTKGDPWDGRIDEVRVYDRNLSAGEISRLYDGTNPVGPVRWNGSIRTSYGVFDAPTNGTNLTVVLGEGGNAVPAGTNVTVVVQADADADGVYEAASDPIVVDGTSDLGAPRPVRNLSATSVRYRLRIGMNTTDVTAGPELDRVVLEARP